MINSIKAILGGFSAILFMGLLAQLIYLLGAVAYISLVKDYPSLSFLSEITRPLLFTISAVIAFIGGMLTAHLARKAVLVHCLAVGAITGALTLIPSLTSGYELTVNGIIFLLIFLLASLAGGLYWKKKHQIKTNTNQPIA